MKVLVAGETKGRLDLLFTRVATVPLGEPIVPMLDSMEMIGQNIQNLALAQYLAVNMQAWRVLHEQMRVWGGSPTTTQASSRLT